MKQFQIQACYLFERPYPQEELFDADELSEPILFSEDTTEEEAKAMRDEPLIGFYTTRYVTAQSMAEAVHYVEEELTTDKDLPEGRLYDLACTETDVRDLDAGIREQSKNSDIPGVWYEDGLSFFSQIEVEQTK